MDESRGRISPFLAESWEGINNIIPADPKYNLPPSVIPITDNVTNDSDCGYFLRPDSESQGDNGLGVPSYFPPEGSSLSQEGSSPPRRSGRGFLKAIYPR